MIITVFGATGHVGRKIVWQGIARGETIRAFGRSIVDLIDDQERNEKLEAIKGYVFEPRDVYNAIQGADAVLSVLGGAFDGTDKTRSLGMKNIVTQMKKAGVQRIVALGGAGVLNSPDGGYLLNQPDYPEEYLPVGQEHLQAFLYLKESGLDWTFLCSPDIKDGKETGNYVTEANYLPTPNNNYITTGDLADFMLMNSAIQNMFISGWVFRDCSLFMTFVGQATNKGCLKISFKTTHRASHLFWK